jgi:hypothetical protein
MRNVETAIFTVGCKVVPSIVSGDRNFLDQMAGAGRCQGRRE